MNMAHDLLSLRQLKEFIMRLHTGETVTQATTNWTWQQRAELGQRILFDLCEDFIIAFKKHELSPNVDELVKKLISQLELDGYIFRDHKLYYSEAAVLDTGTEEGILEKLIKDLSLEKQDILTKALELSSSHFLEENWEDSIANSRKFFEGVMQETAARIHRKETGTAIETNIYDYPVKVRDYLEEKGLLEPKEKEAIKGAYAMMSATGSHPYTAKKDQARLLRHLALTFSQFVMLRLQGALQK